MPTEIANWRDTYDDTGQDYEEALTLDNGTLYVTTFTRAGARCECSPGKLFGKRNTDGDWCRHMTALTSPKETSA